MVKQRPSMLSSLLRYGYAVQYRARRMLCRTRYRLFGTIDHNGEPFDPKRVKRLLLVFTGAIGDSILCLPTVMEMRRLLPEAECFALVNSSTKEIWEMATNLDGFFVYNYSPLPLLPSKRRELSRLKREIETAGINLVVVLWGDDWIPLFYQCGIPWRVGYQESYYRFLLTHTYPMKGFSKDPTNGFTPEEWLGALRSLGFDPVAHPVLFRIPSEAEAKVNYLLNQYQITQHDKIAVIHPFGRHKWAWWPFEKALDAVHRLANTGIKCIIVGGAHEADVIMLETSDGCMINLTGKLSLTELCALIRRANLVITTDSGPMHIAGILKRPTIGLFRALRLNQSYRYRERFVPLWNGDNKRCMKSCHWDHCAAVPCRQMLGITVDEVVRNALTLIE